MNRRSMAALCFGVLLSGAVRAQAPDAEAVRLATDAARQWLALVDSGDYAASWDRAAAAFQTAITKAQWTAALQQVRAPLGGPKTRELKSAVFSRSLPGAPAGEYVVIQFQTQFASSPGGTETVTPMKDKDGQWRVSGYFIK